MPGEHGPETPDVAIPLDTPDGILALKAALSKHVETRSRPDVLEVKLDRSMRDAFKHATGPVPVRCHLCRSELGEVVDEDDARTVMARHVAAKHPHPDTSGSTVGLMFVEPSKPALHRAAPTPTTRQGRRRAAREGL